MRVGVVGLGYVGTALAKAAFAAGHEVIGVDVDFNRIDELKKSVKFQVLGNYESLSDCEVVVIAVPTPLDEKRIPDLQYLEAATQALSRVLKSGTLVINESTSYPGTLRGIVAAKLGNSYLFASAPERVDPGNSKWNVRNTPRLTGGLTTEATGRAADFYRSFCDEVITVTSPEVAEAAKLFENTFRQVNIALVNEFAQVADALGIPTFETLSAAATKPFGFMPFTPSVGVGGHCIPVDPSYLSYAAQKVGLATRFINLANEVNLAMPEFVVQKIVELLNGSILGKKIQIAGIAYKADVSDIRESPALALIELLRKSGADVSWHDSLVGKWKSESSVPLEAADLGVIVTARSGVDYSPWKNERTMVIDVSTSANTGWPKFL